MQNILSKISQEKRIKKASLLLFIFLAYLFALMSFQILEDTENVSYKYTDPILLLAFQGISSLLLFLLPSLLSILWVLKLEMNSFIKPIRLNVIIMTILITFGCMIINSLFIEWNMSVDLPDSDFEQWVQETEEYLKEVTEYLTSFTSAGHFWFSILIIGGLAAFCEELLFRGVIQNLFYTVGKNHHLAIWGSSLLFGIVHMQFYGIIPRILLGVLFGYLYFWSGNLSVVMLAHFFNNAMGLAVTYLMKIDLLDISEEQMESSPPLPIIFVFVILVIWWMVLFIRYHKKIKVIQK